VDPAYRRMAEWMFHDSTLKAIKKLKDSEGRPLWAPGIAVREPNTILGYPYVVNNDMPVMAADAKSILFGDFSNYFIRDVLGVQLLRWKSVMPTTCRSDSSPSPATTVYWPMLALARSVTIKTARPNTWWAVFFWCGSGLSRPHLLCRRWHE